MVYVKRAVYIGTPKIFYEIEFTNEPMEDASHFSELFGISYAGSEYESDRDWYWGPWHEDDEEFINEWNVYWELMSQTPNELLAYLPYFLVIKFEETPAQAYGPFSPDVDLISAFEYVVSSLGKPSYIVELLSEYYGESYKEWVEDMKYTRLDNYRVLVRILKRFKKTRKFLFIPLGEDTDVDPHEFYLEKDLALALMFINKYHLVDSYIVENVDEHEE